MQGDIGKTSRWIPRNVFRTSNCESLLCKFQNMDLERDVEMVRRTQGTALEGQEQDESENPSLGTTDPVSWATWALWGQGQESGSCCCPRGTLREREQNWDLRTRTGDSFTDTKRQQINTPSGGEGRPRPGPRLAGHTGSSLPTALGMGQGPGDV